MIQYDSISGHLMKKILMSFRVNGESYEVAAPPNRLLLDVLREELNLTGTKLGCDDGSCGACTVLVDGVPSQCCMMLAVSYQGREVRQLKAWLKTDNSTLCKKHFAPKGASNAASVLRVY